MVTNAPAIKKLTTILIVDAIEPHLPGWQKLGLAVSVRVPEEGPLGFVILSGRGSELMLQTRASLREDLPAVFELEPQMLFYADVTTLEQARTALGKHRALVKERTTFYGALESWVVLASGEIVGLSQH